LTIGILSLALRLWLLDKRWINPDEGAHLMDAVFVIDGKTPSVDFNSRQPFYAYTNAVFLKIFGINYISGRLLPMVFSLLVGVMVFLIADALFERRVAILSAAIYWLLPLELINSVVVKTEPLTMLLTCLSLYAVILFSQSDNKVWLVMAGIFAAIGYYVRQSALIIPLAVLGYLFIHHTIRFRDIAKNFGFFIIGYTCVFLLALIYFSRFMGLEKFLMGDLSPLGFLASAAKKTPSLLGISANQVNDIASQATGVSHKQYGLYYAYVRQALKMHAFLIVGFGFSIFVFSRQIISDKKIHINKHFRSHSLLYLWVLSLLLAYAYYYYTEAFYIDYCREFLPPLVILFSAWLVHAAPVLKRDKILDRFVIAGFCISIAIFFVAPHFKNFIGQGIIIGLSIALFTMIYFAADFGSKSRRTAFLFSLTVLSVIILFSRQALFANYLSGIVSKLTLIVIILILPWVFFARNLRPTIKEYFKFISFAVVLGAFTLSLTHSAYTLTFAYDSMWSPASLEETSAYLKSNTHSNDTVMSGAVIWELQTLRRPFLGISHPLIFERQISEKDRQRIEVAIKNEPPDAIIIDGFTEKTYFRQFPWLWSLLAAKYDLVHTSGPARRLVEIYRPKN
jgi:4-amino-4-deoxy-L-arabinose transferase-like glycosyltransferase